MDEDTCFCETSLPTSLKRLLTLEETADVTLVGADGKKPVRAHKAVLASASEFFMRMFFGECSKVWEENAEGVVKLEEFSSDAIRMIVDIVYTGRAEVSYQTSLELFSAADFFNIPQLEEAYDYFLRRYGRDIVQNEFQSFSAPLLRKVLASDALGCEEIVIFKAVEQWIEAHKVSLSGDDIKEIVGMVRYGLIPANELVSVVGLSKWKDEALLFAALSNWIEPDVGKIKVPQHLARANTFPLVSFKPGTYSSKVSDGVCTYHIDPLPKQSTPVFVHVTMPGDAGSAMNPAYPNVGVLLAVDNLEVPITISVSSCQGQTPSLSFSALPAKDEQAIVFSHAWYLPQTHGHPFSELNPVPIQPLLNTLGHVTFGGGLFHEALGGGLGGHTGMQGSASEMCISKDGDGVVIAVTELGSREGPTRYGMRSTAKHILIGMKVNASAKLKLVPRS